MGAGRNVLRPYTGDENIWLAFGALSLRSSLWGKQDGGPVFCEEMK